MDYNSIIGQVASGQVNRIDRRVDRIQAALGLDVFSDSSTVVGDYGRNTQQDVLNWLQVSAISEDEVDPLPRKALPKVAIEAKLEELVTSGRPSQPNRSSLKHRSTEATSDYLDSSFDLYTLTVPKLRSLLLEHGVSYTTGATKDVLVSLAKELQGLQENAYRISAGEMRRRCQQGDNLISIGGRVYDLQNFLEEHP